MSIYLGVTIGSKKVRKLDEVFSEKYGKCELNGKFLLLPQVKKNKRIFLSEEQIANKYSCYDAYKVGNQATRYGMADLGNTYAAEINS